MKKNLFVMLTTTILLAILFTACDDGNSEKPAIPVPKLNPPDFDPSRATDFETTQVVTIEGVGAPESAKIHYTLNGDTPSETVGGSTLLYNSTDKITLDTTATIKAIVIADNMITSDVGISPVFTKFFVWGGELDVTEPQLVDNVYELYLPSDLAWIAEQTNDFSGKTIKLMNDFNMNEQQFNGIKTFSGIFDGNNKRLMKITMIHPTEDGVGFVWVLNDGGIIKNLTIETGTITGGEDTGGFVGRNMGTATLEGLVNGAGVTGSTIAGGIVGKAATGSDITMTNIENSGTIAADSYAGGVIGYDEGSTTIVNVENWGYIQQSANSGGIIGYGAANIQNAGNFGLVTATDYAGGIFGVAISGASVENVKNVNTITGTQAGGIAGLWSGGKVIKAENTGVIQVLTTGSNAKAGGIIASVAVPMTISNSGNSREIKETGGGTSLVGGIIGSSTATITISNSYNYGSLPTTAGGMVGQIPVGGSCTINTSYYLNTTATTVVGTGTATGGAPLTAAQFTNQNSFAGWDFATIWEMEAKYPTLK